jgi:hypothetical protein
VVLVDVEPRDPAAGTMVLHVELDMIEVGPGSMLELTGRFAGSTGAVILVYGPAVRATALLVPAAARALSAHGVWIVDAILVDGELWWSLMFGDRCCRPETGTPVRSPDGQPSAIAAMATCAGWTAHPDREALRRSLDPVPPPDQAELAAALAAAEAEMVAAAAVAGGRPGWRRSTVELFRTVLRQARERVDRYPPHHITTEDLGRLLVGLLDLVVRDGCWRALEIDASSTAFNLCWELARRAPEPYRAPPLFLLGWVAWRRGDGVLAGLAAERCLAADAEYEAARLLRVVVDRCIPPTRVPRMRPSRRIRRKPR